MGDILEEAGHAREDIIDYVSVIDEKTYMEYDKQGESFNVDDFPDLEVKCLLGKDPYFLISVFTDIHKNCSSILWELLQYVPAHKSTAIYSIHSINSIPLYRS